MPVPHALGEHRGFGQSFEAVESPHHGRVELLVEVYHAGAREYTDFEDVAIVTKVGRGRQPLLQRARGLPPEQRVVRRADGIMFLCGGRIRRSGASRRTAKERQQDEEGSDEEEERVPEDEIRHSRSEDHPASPQRLPKSQTS